MNLEIRKVVRTIESDYAAARAKEAALQADADRQQQAALNLKELAVQHTLLQGEFEANRTIFANVLKRLNEASVSTDSPLSNMQITEPAEMPRGPSSPQTRTRPAPGLGLRPLPWSGSRPRLRTSELVHKNPGGGLACCRRSHIGRNPPLAILAPTGIWVQAVAQKLPAALSGPCQR